jgi:hypothetical protein
MHEVSVRCGVVVMVWGGGDGGGASWDTSVLGYSSKQSSQTLLLSCWRAYGMLVCGAGVGQSSGHGGGGEAYRRLMHVQDTAAHVWNVH